MGQQAFLHVDLVLEAMIGPEPGAVDGLIAAAERGEHELRILEQALYYAFCCVQEYDRLNLPRIRRLLSCAGIVPSPRPFEPAGIDEIAGWRQAALGEG